MDVFKVPHTIPQDLLLIQDLVNEPFIPTQPAPASVTRNVSDDDCIDSSGSEGESEIEMKEIEADLLEKPDETLLELT
jgi:H/ACA ribonucleoprotein complex non-core subunit NAF1